MKIIERDFRHHHNRRKRGHDYREPWKYHITITKHDSCPDSSRLHWEELLPDKVGVKLSKVGIYIWNQILKFPMLEPKIKVLQYKIMPDHIHILIEVLEMMENPLGEVIRVFKREIVTKLRLRFKKLFKFNVYYNLTLTYG